MSRGETVCWWPTGAQYHREHDRPLKLDLPLDVTCRWCGLTNRDIPVDWLDASDGPVFWPVHSELLGDAFAIWREQAYACNTCLALGLVDDPGIAAWASPATPAASTG